MPPRLHVEEVLINGRRYRVPERIITMDFWAKTGKAQATYSEYVPAQRVTFPRPDRGRSHAIYESGTSSPLTSLSGNSDDEYDEPVVNNPVKTFDLEELRAAVVSQQPLVFAPDAHSKCPVSLWHAFRSSTQSSCRSFQGHHSQTRYCAA